jgi:hypothetical protein
MKHEEPGLAPANNPYGDFTAVDVRTIYAVFIDRYEHLDMVLRSLPSPKAREEAQEEKARVETIIRHICAPLIT